MIQHRLDHEGIPLSEINELEVTLGLQPSWPGRTLRDMWDAIAHRCHLPDTAALATPHDGPGINVVPGWLWNSAVDEANRSAS